VTSGLTAITPESTASFMAPENGARARFTVFGASPLPFLTPPPFIILRCQATTTSAVMSRTFREPSRGRMYDSE
jgi:hypothetical protein